MLTQVAKSLVINPQGVVITPELTLTPQYGYSGQTDVELAINWQGASGFSNVLVEWGDGTSWAHVPSITSEFPPFKPKHRYASAPINQYFMITVKIQDYTSGDSGTAQIAVWIVAPLTVDFTATPTSGPLPLDVDFTINPKKGYTPYSSIILRPAVGIADITIPAAGPFPYTKRVRYSTAGTYTATVTVTDWLGSQMTLELPLTLPDVGAWWGTLTPAQQLMTALGILAAGAGALYLLKK